MLPTAVCAALADPARLRLYGAICREADGVRTADLRLDTASRKALARLVGTGLVQRRGERYVAGPEVFRQAIEDQQAAGRAGDGPGFDAVSGRVAALFRGGRLTAMPRSGELRTELLRTLARRFEPGRTYSEAEVRRELQAVHDDHAALRRYLVDEGLLERDNHGTYWRPLTAAG